MSRKRITRRTALVVTGAAAASTLLPLEAAGSEVVGVNSASVAPARAGPFGIILDAVAGHYAVTQEELFSDDRSKRVVRPRQMAMYLAFMLSGRSLPEIGRRIGGRDHTTVLHACRKLEGLKQTDRDEAAVINKLLARCVRAMRDNAIPLDRKRYAEARWFLKVKPTRGLSPLRAQKYGDAELARREQMLARIIRYSPGGSTG